MRCLINAELSNGLFNGLTMCITNDNLLLNLEKIKR